MAVGFFQPEDFFVLAAEGRSPDDNMDCLSLNDIKRMDRVEGVRGPPHVVDEESMLTWYLMLAWNSSTHGKRAPWRLDVDGREWTAPRSMDGMFLIPFSGLDSKRLFKFLGPRVIAAVAPAATVGLAVHILDESAKIEARFLRQFRTALIRLELLRGSILAGMPKKLMR